MIKIFCNRCKQEITDRNFSCKIEIEEVGQVLLPVKGVKDQAFQRVEKWVYHICKLCWLEIKKPLNDKV